MQSVFESENPPLVVALRLQSPPVVQHCAAIASVLIGSEVCVGSVTHDPELSFLLPLSTQTPSPGKTIGGNGGGEGGGGDGGGGEGDGGGGDGDGGGGDGGGDESAGSRQHSSPS